MLQREEYTGNYKLQVRPTFATNILLCLFEIWQTWSVILVSNWSVILEISQQPNPIKHSTLSTAIIIKTLQFPKLSFSRNQSNNSINFPTSDFLLFFSVIFYDLGIWFVLLFCPSLQCWKKWSFIEEVYKKMGSSSVEDIPAMQVNKITFKIVGFA